MPPPPSPPPRARHRRLVLAATAVLVLVLLPSAQGFVPFSGSPTTSSALPQPGVLFTLPTGSNNFWPRSSFSRPRTPTVLFAAATTDTTNNLDENDDDNDWVESPCPCTELGQGTGDPGPLTERCDIGDVVVLALPPSVPPSVRPHPLALAVVDGPSEVCLLCMRDPDCNEWYRDYRDEEATVLKDMSAAALVRVISDAYYSQRNIPSLGATGYGAEAEDCWLIEEKDIPEGVGRPLEFTATAPWMFLGS